MTLFYKSEQTALSLRLWGDRSDCWIRCVAIDCPVDKFGEQRLKTALPYVGHEKCDTLIPRRAAEIEFRRFVTEPSASVAPECRHISSLGHAALPMGAAA